MESPSKFPLLAFVLTALGGVALHFLYPALPSPITALIAPVNESLWEHGKLLFVPVLVALTLLKPANPAPWLLGLLLAVALMQGVGYLYHVTLQQTALWVDIVLYFVSMALVFLLPQVFNQLGGTKVLVFATVALGLAFALFTFLPPDAILFQDLSAVHTFFTIPY